uniref:Secreted protein n=1 Tax=Achlya hypogyna TaxID=1202772 RepID=A0A0A7CN41_ACHHY|nr:secreted protein [Achlya hypogyna]
MNNHVLVLATIVAFVASQATTEAVGPVLAVATSDPAPAKAVDAVAVAPSDLVSTSSVDVPAAVAVASGAGSREGFAPQKDSVIHEDKGWYGVWNGGRGQHNTGYGVGAGDGYGDAGGRGYNDRNSKEYVPPAYGLWNSGVVKGKAYQQPYAGGLRSTNYGYGGNDAYGPSGYEGYRW